MLPLSVIVPVKNEAGCLPGCLAALAAQTLPPSEFEVIVVDGESHDGTAELVRASGHRLVEADEPGVSAARNAGVRVATGDLLCFTDADCRPDPGWLEGLARRFAADADLAGAGGPVRHRAGPGSPFAARFEDAAARAVYRGFITSNLAFRREWFLLAGGFDERLSCAEDADLVWRILDLGGRVEFEPGASVLHVPPEERSLGAWLAKHAWYARRDVPALARHARRLVDARGPAARSARAHWNHARPALLDAAQVTLAAGALALRSPPLLAAAAGLAAARALRFAARVRRTSREVHDPGVAALLAGEAARTAVRGAGTLAGAASWAAERLRSTPGRARGAGSGEAPASRALRA